MKKMKKYYLPILLSFGLVIGIGISVIFVIVNAVESRVVGDFEILGPESSYNYENNVLTIVGNDTITIQNTNLSIASHQRIVIAEDVAANIILNGVHIDVSAQNDVAAINLLKNSNTVNITLANNSQNYLKSGKNCAGLQKSGGSDGTLIISGTGSLKAIGGENGCGIGGGYFVSAPIEESLVKNIVIENGIIESSAGPTGTGTGIGGMRASHITINDGNIKAYGSGNGAGIGGSRGEGHDINITGGKIRAVGGYADEGYQSGFGAGIGGSGTGDGYNITISGGSVSAIAGDIGGAGIGSGLGGNLNAFQINISGGFVYANGSVAIGAGGDSSSCSDITISGGSLDLEGYVGNTIGTADGKGTSNLVITGGNIWNDYYESSEAFGCIPTDGLGRNVYPVEIKFQDLDEVITITQVNVTYNDTELIYHTGSMKTHKDYDDYQKVWLYLPEDAIVNSFKNDQDSFANLSLTPICVSADGFANGTVYNVSEATGSYKVSGGDYGVDFEYDTSLKRLVIKNSKPIIVSSKKEIITDESIYINKDINADITLDNVKIDMRTQNNSSAIKIADDSIASIQIHQKVGTENYLFGGLGHAGIEMNGSGQLYIDGAGILNAVGGEGAAGIGGGDHQKTGHIIIQNGTICVTGGSGADAIGNGKNASANPDKIEICGGNIKIVSGEMGVTPVNREGIPVYQTKLRVYYQDTKMLDIKSIKQAQQRVIYDTDGIYVYNDTKNQGDGWIQLWLPKNDLVETTLKYQIKENIYTYSGYINDSYENQLKMKQNEFKLTLKTDKVAYGEQFEIVAEGGMTDEVIYYKSLSDSIDIDQNGKGQFLKATDFEIQAILSGDDFYWDGEAKITGQVHRRQVVLGWNGIGEHVYDGKPVVIMAYVQNKLKDDEVYVVVENGLQSAVGKYEAKAIGLMGEDSDNYILNDFDSSMTYTILENLDYEDNNNLNNNHESNDDKNNNQEMITHPIDKNNNQTNPDSFVSTHDRNTIILWIVLSIVSLLLIIFIRLRCYIYNK